MVGPSSSHTAGALRIAKLALKLLKDELILVRFTLYGSFARTYSGHGTDKALLAGALGFDTDDERIRNSFAFAKERKLDFTFHTNLNNTDLHPNTVDIYMESRSGEKISVRGVSLGGGRAMLSQLNGFDIYFDGSYDTLVVPHTDMPGILSHLTKAVSKRQINIAKLSCFRENKGEGACAIIELDSPVEEAIVESLKKIEGVSQCFYIKKLASNSIKEGEREDLVAPTLNIDEISILRKLKNKERGSYDFKTAKELLDICEREQISIAETVILRERELFGSDLLEIYLKMARAWKIMKNSCIFALNNEVKTMGGLIGGEGKLLANTFKSSSSLMSNFAHKAITYAMAVMETNAAMGIIVAAPTAGSAGVVPAVLQAFLDEENIEEEKIIEALFVTAGIGLLITLNATVAGAEGACQAEVGSASAMAAAGLCFLKGEGVRTQANAASITLANMLGLVCDPIRGLVESPCQQRNAMGASSAITAAELSMAGINNVLELDEMIEVMYSVGKSMPASLRETALGGMASASKFCNCP